MSGLTEDENPELDLLEQKFSVKGVCFEVQALNGPILGPMAWQEKTGEDCVQVAAVAFWDRPPTDEGPLLVEYQAYHPDYVHLTPDIKWGPGKPATHVTIVTIESLEGLNKPALLTVTGYGRPVLMHPDRTAKVEVAE